MSCRAALQKCAPIDDVKDEEREREEESGNLINVNGGGSSLAILNCWWPRWTSASFGIWPYWCLCKKKIRNISYGIT